MHARPTLSRRPNTKHRGKEKSYLNFINQHLLAVASHETEGHKIVLIMIKKPSKPSPTGLGGKCPLSASFCQSVCFSLRRSSGVFKDTAGGTREGAEEEEELKREEEEEEVFRLL